MLAHAPSHLRDDLRAKVRLQYRRLFIAFMTTASLISMAGVAPAARKVFPESVGSYAFTGPTTEFVRLPPDPTAFDRPPFGQDPGSPPGSVVPGLFVDLYVPNSSGS